MPCLMGWLTGSMSCAIEVQEVGILYVFSISSKVNDNQFYNINSNWKSVVLKNQWRHAAYMYMYTFVCTYVHTQVGHRFDQDVLNVVLLVSSAVHDDDRYLSTCITH